MKKWCSSAGTIVMGVIVLMLTLPGVASAHAGPTDLRSIIENVPVGPYTVTVLANPQPHSTQLEVVTLLEGRPLDEGGTVFLEARHMEKRTEAPVQGSMTARLGDHFYTVMPLTEPGDWQVTVFIDGDVGPVETRVTVEVPPRRAETGTPTLVGLTLVPLLALAVTLVMLRWLGVPVLEPL